MFIEGGPEYGGTAVLINKLFLLHVHVTPYSALSSLRLCCCAAHVVTSLFFATHFAVVLFHTVLP